MSGATPVAGQEGILNLAQECGGGDPTAVDRCREVALRIQSARGVVGLIAGGGPEVPGSAGTVGLRIGNVPRVSVAARLNAADASFTGALPPAGNPLSGGTLPADDVFVTGLDLTGVVGVFDGFSPLPTVGGVLSLDLLATGSFLFLPEDRGFPSSEFVFGAGARLGLLRESFSLPGVSASVVRRWGGETNVEGGTGVGSGAFELSSTSLRVTVGKDLVGVGLLLGTGLDRYSGAVSISTSGASGPVGDPAWDATAGELTDTRPVFFGGASLNYLVLQLSAEVGWMGGFDEIPGRSSGYDPTRGSWFGGLGVRLTY
ncbi:MAG: hypothetical protein R3223_00715 [Longimicrobiales bacterium]|nr:hypothetical protein [Longimicrobiales bacterium]